MQTPLLIKMGAKEAQKILQDALSDHEKIYEHTVAKDNQRSNIMKEPVDNLYHKMKQVNEWLHAIQEQ